jgi:isoleucyl-tRNA synthetase
LLQRWQRLVTLREEVNKALELARRDNRIGSSLAARVILETPDDETREFLQSFGDELHFLFITSAVAFGSVGEDAFRSPELPGFAVEVQQAAGSKCERCWNWTEDVGGDTDWPGICARCSESIKQVRSDAGPA